MKPTFFHSVRITIAGLAQNVLFSQSGGLIGRPVASASFQISALTMPTSRLNINWNTSAAATMLLTTGMK